MVKLTAFFAIFIMILGCSLVWAAPIDLPSGVANPEGMIFKSENEGVIYRTKMDTVNEWLDNVSASISIEYERTEDREFDGLGAEAEGKVYKGKVGVSIYNKVNIYGFIGQTDDFEYRAQIQGANVVFDLKDETLWGGGINCVLYDWADAGVKLFADAKYTKMEDASYSSVSVNNSTFAESQLTTPTTDAQYREWQGALGISLQIGRIIPYAGVSYADAEIKARATAGGTTYDLGTLENDEKIGPFFGLAFNPFDGLSLKGQARFSDGQTFSGSAMFRF
jgi:hypothetical protein